MLHSSLVAVSDLRERDRRTLMGLMDAHYSRVDHRQFEADLAEKEGCILLHDDNAVIRGFSTFTFLHTRYRSDPVIALFSGDTVIERGYWGSLELFRAFGRLLEGMLREHGDRLCYWFLLSQGFRTYLLLPLGFKSYTPGLDCEPSAFEAGLLDHLARSRYGDAYDPNRGIVRKPNYHLREQLAVIPPHRRSNPHVLFFLERNPGYLTGDELACLCRISDQNFRRRTAVFEGGSPTRAPGK
jgi:hypothetical protein